MKKREKKLLKKEGDIKKYYFNRFWDIATSFFISFISGLMVAILIAIIVGQQPLESFQKFGMPLYLWGVIAIAWFVFFLMVFTLTLVLIPMKIELSKLKKKVQKKIKPKNIKFKILDVINSILGVSFSGLIFIASAGLLIEFAKKTQLNDYSLLLEYAKISLTLFGFTLIGAIFDKKKSVSYVVKKLFHISLVFLASAFGFFMVYWMSFIPFDTCSGTLQCLMFHGIFPFIGSLFLFGGYIGIVYGIIRLLWILIDFAKGAK